MVSICWVKEHEILINKNNPGAAFSDGANQPRGYHHLMLRGETNRLRILNPNLTTYTNVFFCGETVLTNYGLPPIRFLRVDKDSYDQNTNYPETHGGNTTHTPGSSQVAFYDAIKNGRITSAQFNAFGDELNNTPDTRPRIHVLTTIGGIANCININGHSQAADMNIHFDNFTANISTTPGTVGGTIFWKTIDELRKGQHQSLLGGGVAVWSALYSNATAINDAQAREMNGVIELVDYEYTQGAGATTGKITLNVFRKKTWNESHYSYDTNL